MIIKQISVFMENKPGKIADITDILASENINIRAVNIADTVDFGILRMIVDKPIEAESILREKNYSVSIADVVAVTIDDGIGMLAKLMDVFKKANLNIDYLYSFIGEAAKAVIVLKTDNTENCLEVLKKNNANILTYNELGKVE